MNNRREESQRDREEEGHTLLFRVTENETGPEGAT